jgi:hypothetical protein
LTKPVARNNFWVMRCAQWAPIWLAQAESMVRLKINLPAQVRAQALCPAPQAIHAG